MSKKKQSKSGGLLGRIIRRFFLLLFIGVPISFALSISSFSS